MKCSDKEWQHCRVEKMGCKECYYNKNKTNKMDDRKALIQRIKTQKGMLQKQSKIINTMCEHLADNDFCFEEGKCKRSDIACEQCIREYFERKVK